MAERSRSIQFHWHTRLASTRAQIYHYYEPLDAESKALAEAEWHCVCSQICEAHGSGAMYWLDEL